MQHELYAQLLFDAIRGTLETMAFAEVVPYSLKVGEQELIDYISLPLEATMQSGNGVSSGFSSANDRSWNYPLDDWTINYALTPEEISISLTDRVDFEKLINSQNDWIWACLNVNSPQLESIWFIVSQKLARELTQMMYAGDNLPVDDVILQDIIAELTNVLGGRLVLLLEEYIGSFALEVPNTGTGQPRLPSDVVLKTVICKVLVDSVYPVMAQLCFREKKQLDANIAGLQICTE
jgi:hypothetical protein